MDAQAHETMLGYPSNRTAQEPYGQEVERQLEAALHHASQLVEEMLHGAKVEMLRDAKEEAHVIRPLELIHWLRVENVSAAQTALSQKTLAISEKACSTA